MRNKAVEQCYLCGSRSTKPAFEKLRWTIVRCGKCGLYRLQFSGSYQKFIRRYYDKGFFTGSTRRVGYYSYEGDRKAEDKNMRAYLHGVQRFKTSGKLLDIGCATGLFMLKAQEAGFDVSGVDVSEYAIGIAKKRFGTKVIHSSVEQVKYPSGSFDVVTMFDVIEHMEDPSRVLRQVNGLLKNDGMLVVNTGDSDSLLARMQGKDWHFFIPPQHFFYFSKRTLGTLMTQTGFKVIAVDRKGKWVTLRYLFHLARQIQQDAIARLGFLLVGKIAPGRIPIYLNLFDNITVYASASPGTTRK